MMWIIIFNIKNYLFLFYRKKYNLNNLYNSIIIVVREKFYIINNKFVDNNKFEL
jgi:hypothetical protein